MKRSVALFIILLLILFSNTTSQAITIGVDPVSQEVPVGNPFAVELFISGLGDGTAPSLGAFDLDISYDPTILDFSSVAFGDPVLGDQLDLSGLGSIAGSDDTFPGIISIFEVSLDAPADLDSSQAGSFTLASLTFNTLALGTSPLNISINALGDSLGEPLDADIQSGSVNVVPEPATLLLVGSGLVGVGFLRKRKFMRSKN